MITQGIIIDPHPPRVRATMYWTMSLNYGDVPTWITGLATVVALTFAYLAARSASKVYRLESQRDIVAEAERTARDMRGRRTQASRIAVWLEPTSSLPPAFNVKYSNTSQLPIREVCVQLRAPNLDGGTIYPFLPPTTEPIVLQDASARLNEHILSDPAITRNTVFSLMSPGQRLAQFERRGLAKSFASLES